MHFARYRNNVICIKLVSLDYLPIATATVNVPDFSLQEGQCLIKDYAENQGVLAALVEANIVQPVGTVPVGYEAAMLCNLLVLTAA